MGTIEHAHLSSGLWLDGSVQRARLVYKACLLLAYFSWSASGFYHPITAYRLAACVTLAGSALISGNVYIGHRTSSRGAVVTIDTGRLTL